MTLEEAFLEKKPNVEHLRIFGCPIDIHIPKDKRKKLKPSRKKSIFVGYSESSKAYRIYIPEQHKVEVSKDVTFNVKMAFKKSIEETIEEEEHEEPKEESTCLPESQNEEIELDHPMQPCEPIESIIVPVIHQIALVELKMSRQRLSRQMLKSQSSEFSRSFKRPPFSAFPSLRGHCNK
jgi:hypothetical protein